MEKKYTILLFYKYVNIADPDQLLYDQTALWQKFGLKGRMIIAHEGVNVTLEGTDEACEKYIEEMKKDESFADIDFKKSEGTGSAFPKASIKIREEIVTLGLGEKDVDPNKVSGKYISPDELHEWYESGKEFYIVDMRNDYEQKIGHFESSILPPLTNFRDLPQVVEDLAEYRDKTLVTFCTGGIRCEKASGFLVSEGFKDVYQLHGGIHRYMEKYPNTHFLGKLYVFDGRVAMAINADSPDHVVVGKCELCEASCDDYANCLYPRCNKHIVACDRCRDENGNVYCSDKCREEMKSYNGKLSNSFRVNQSLAA